MSSPMAFRSSTLYDSPATTRSSAKKLGQRLEVPAIPYNSPIKFSGDVEAVPASPGGVPEILSTETPLPPTSFIFTLLYIGYASIYAARRSLSFLAPHLTSDLGFSKLQLGSLSSTFSLSYAVNKFVAGVLADAYPPALLFSFGLIANGLLYLSLGFSSSFGVFTVVSILNGITQAVGLAPVGGLLEIFWGPSRKGSLWSSISTAANVGNALMPLVGGGISYFFGWQSLFFAMGLLCVSAGVASLFYLHYRANLATGGTGRSPRRKRKRLVTFSEVFENLYRNVFSNRVLWLLSSAYFFVYVIRSALSDWSVMYLVEHKDYTPMLAASAMVWLEVGGFAGAFTIGWISDKLFGSRRGPPIALFLILSLLSVALTSLFSLNKSSYVLDCALLLFNGYSIYGPQVLISVMASDLVGEGASSSAVGFVGIFAALGGSLAGAPMSILIHHFSWTSMHLAVICSGTVALGCLLPLWNAKKQPKRE